MKRLFLPFLLFTINNIIAQQTIFESMGSVSGTTSISAHEASNGFDNDDLTYSGTGDVRITSPSPNGGANIFLTGTPASPRTFIIGNLKTNAAVTSIDIDLQVFKSISAANNDLVVEYTINGTTYLDPQVINITTGSSWTTQTVSFLSPPQGITAIRFTNQAIASATVQYRLDAINIVANGSGAALPVKLAKFDVNRDGKNATLHWATSTEINSAYFIIEHSSDGKHFEDIGRVEGNGSSQTTKTYFFSHKNIPSGVNYYRLTQVDYDGRSETFETKSIDMGHTNLIKAFPTVTTDYISIENPEDASIGLYDANGKLQMEIKNENSINISNLVSGIYFLKTPQQTIKIRKI